RLPVLRYPRRSNVLRRIDGRWYTDEQLHDRQVLGAFGFNPREVIFIATHGLTELPRLYLAPYFDAIQDLYQPLGVGLDELDQMTRGRLPAKAQASDAAFRFSGARRGDDAPAAGNTGASALYRVWQSAIRARRGVAEAHQELYRVRGGNQVLTDTFAAKLG